MARLRLWIGASTADACVRLAAQTLTTIVVARLLPAETFGVALMILSVVAVFSAFIGLPLEESLAQRQRLTLGHVQSALFVSLMLTVVVLVVVLAASPTLARVTGVPEIALWLPVATLFLVGEGPGAIVRALARRHRRFVALAVSQSAGVVVASAVAIAAVDSGYGIAALILQRMLPVVLLPLVALALATGKPGRTPVVRPAWHPARFRELFRFSWLHLSDVGVGAATPAVAAYMINGTFGTAMLGQLNIALRIVDPLRQLIGGIGHNLVFSLLYRMQDDPARLSVAAAQSVVNVGVLAVPAFLGLAVCSPLLLPLLAGPGWEAAIPLSRALCLGAAVYVPFGFLYSGFSAMGRPELGLAGSCLRLAVIVAGLGLIAFAGIDGGIGSVMAAGDVAVSGFAVALLLGYAGAGAGEALGKVARLWAAALVMAIVLDLFVAGIGAAGPPVLELALIILSGALLYPILLLGFCPSCAGALRDRVFSRREIE